MGTSGDDPPSGPPGGRSKGAIRLEKRRRVYSKLLADLQAELGAKPGKGKKRIMQHCLLAMAIKWLGENGNDEVEVDINMKNEPLGVEEIEVGVSPWLVEDLVLLLDTQGTVVCSLNMPFTALGVPPESLEGMSLFELVYWTDLSRVFGMFKRGVKTEDRLQCRLGLKNQFHVFHLLLRPVVMKEQGYYLLSGRYVGPADDCMAVQPISRKEQPPKWYRAWCLNTADIGVVGVWSNNSRNSICGYPTQYVMNVSPYIYCHPDDLAGIYLAVNAVVREHKVAYMCNRLYTHHNTWMMTENLMYPCINRRTGELEYYVSEGIHTDALSTFPMASRANESRALEGEPIYYDTVDELIERVDRLVLLAGHEFQQVTDACDRVEEELILTEHSKLAAILNPCRRQPATDVQRPAVLSQALDRYQNPPCLIPPMEDPTPVIADTVRIRFDEPVYRNMPQISAKTQPNAHGYHPDTTCLPPVDAPMRQSPDAIFEQIPSHAVGQPRHHMLSEELMCLDSMVSSQVQTPGYRVTTSQSRGSYVPNDAAGYQSADEILLSCLEPTPIQKPQMSDWRKPPASTLSGSRSESDQSSYTHRRNGSSSTNRNTDMVSGAPRGLDLAAVLANDSVLDAFLMSGPTNSMAGRSCSHGTRSSCSCESTPRPTEQVSDWVSPVRDAHINPETLLGRTSNPNPSAYPHTSRSTDFTPPRRDPCPMYGNVGAITNNNRNQGVGLNFIEGQSLAPATENVDAALALLKEMEVSPQELEILLQQVLATGSYQISR